VENDKKKFMVQKEVNFWKSPTKEKMDILRKIEHFDLAG